MPGIYIHIPFCKQACHYCDFHFSTSLQNKKSFLSALEKEIELQKNFFEKESSTIINTIYFGGGTPSLLSYDELAVIFEKLNKYFTISPTAEITLEANPDDLNSAKLKELANSPINRLSIGIQSFYEDDLKWMNRAHNAEQAISSVKGAQDKGLENITIDLIYGVPTLDNSKWKNNLQKAFELSVPHVSAYCLTVEPRTALADMIKKKKVLNINEQQSIEHFSILVNEMKQHNFVQYEISNFCKNEKYSKHNSNYWKGESYLGLGPSAHSFDGKNRQWNVSNNALYINSLTNNKIPFELEELSEKQRYNEYILTSLRTMWGTSLNHIEKAFGEEYVQHCLKEAQVYFSNLDLMEQEKKLLLTDKGKLIADKIASDLFII
jgi:oxygen-independent coproporphyrinogen-3 oxidase